MTQVRFTRNIQRHVPCPTDDVRGRTVREVLDAYFSTHVQARGYVLDEQGALRKHMNIFVDSRPVNDRTTLSDPVTPEAAIDVMQALSGG